MDTKTDIMESSKEVRYERYRPRMYHRKMSIFWWTNRMPYVKFIVRELTSVFVAAYAILLMVKIHAISQGPEAWESLLASFSVPLSITLHAVILGFLIFHSITWFMLAPSAMVVKVGKKRLPGTAIILANFLMWIVLSAGIAWLILSV